MEKGMMHAEYVERIAQLVGLNLDGRSGLTTVALVGERLHAQGLGHEWKKHGVKSFLQFLQLQDCFAVEKTPRGAWGVRLSSGAPQKLIVRERAFNPLRKPIWAAFVLPSPAGRRFLHRGSGEVLFAQTSEPSPGDEWVEILPFSEAAQIEWAKKFMFERHIEATPAVTQALGAKSWPRDFPVALATISPAFQADWNRHRTSIVSGKVRDWAEAHGVKHDLLFLVSKKSTSHLGPPTSMPIQGREGKSSDSEIRSCILSALAKLPTEKLLKLELPAGLLLSEFAARSADEQR